MIESVSVPIESISSSPVHKQVALVPHRRRKSFNRKTVEYFDSIAEDYDRWHGKMSYFVEHTTTFLRGCIPEGKSVLLVGALSPEILMSLKPSRGVGIDVSPRLIQEVRKRNTDPRISYITGSPEEVDLDEKFDHIILLNVADITEDLFVLIESLRRFSTQDTRVVISTLNPLWYKAVRYASWMKLRIPDTLRNLSIHRILATALRVKGFEVGEVHQRILLPKRVPMLSWFFNQILSRIPLINSLCFIRYVTARPVNLEASRNLSCSVIVPCFNEEENILECIQRVPQMGTFTEIVVVNDGSVDDTESIVRDAMKTRKDVNLVWKGCAVLEGIRASKGDVVMILDADMTVRPEELPEFFEAIDRNVAEFVSGTRFLYPMQREAMRLANFFGNVLFSKIVQIVAGTPCTDSLCGTKAMLRKDFVDLEIEDSSWGDFDLLFHAARRKLTTVQIPVHYMSRVAGESKMKSLRAGVTFLKLCANKWAEIP